ncbi:uncharacterized protein LOC111324060 [Stylophora pistillata]|uniref:uncharacterized protein LOC111324060 n=1 Tax=Stylophora pistillata TaxID=50429 RepID=UPI000C047BFE|nr:uncharacterized protein LOC111324060 [Stylophora pistillata]
MAAQCDRSLKTGNECIETRHLVATGFDDISEAVSENEDNLESTQTDKTLVIENTTQTEDKVFEDRESQTEHNNLIVMMENEIAGMKAEIDKLMKQTGELKAKLLNVDRFHSKSSSISFYTRFPDFEVFKKVFDFLDPGEYGQNIRYWTSLNTEEPPLDIYDNEHDSVHVKLPPFLRGSDQMAADVVATQETASLRIHVERAINKMKNFQIGDGVVPLHQIGLANQMWAVCAFLCNATVSRIVISWINFMYLRFGVLNIWPSREAVNRKMPEDFRKLYPSTRVIIDRTEVKCAMPSSLLLNSELLSAYKNHTTLKGLLEISPSGAITYISQLYTGSISDREIVERSGMLDLPFNEGDSMMADKGFTISDILP